MTFPIIHILPAGGVGNRMFQYMLARVLVWHVPEAAIAGPVLPEWGIVPAAIPDPPPNQIRVRGHRVRPDRLVDGLREPSAFVSIAGPTARLAIYEPHRAMFRKLFDLPRRTDIDFDRHLVIHVRLNGLGPRRELVHASYPVLPIAWYEALIERTGLKPLFVGPFRSDRYSQALRERFPEAAFFHSADPMDDFAILHSASSIAIAPSTFSWLAAWLSPHTRLVELPIAGLFNPDQRADIDLLPVGDDRYRFWPFPADRWLASDEQLEARINGTDRSAPIDSDVVRTRYLPMVRDRLAYGGPAGGPLVATRPP